MKSVGEAMAIGRTFKESLPKCLRSLEIGRSGLGGDGKRDGIFRSRRSLKPCLILDATTMPRLTALRLVGRCCRNAFSIWATEHRRPTEIKSTAAPPAKAPEGWRTPRRFATSGRHRERASVLDCGGPPPLLKRKPRKPRENKSRIPIRVFGVFRGSPSAANAHTLPAFASKFLSPPTALSSLAGMISRCLVLLVLVAVSNPLRAADTALHRYLYCATPDGAQPESASGEGLLVFDIDAGFKFVRRIANSNLTFGARGLTGCLATHSLYYSTTDRRLGQFDLETEKVVWENQFSGGCDRSSVTLDGKLVYAPTGWWEKSGQSGFIVIDGNTGAEIKRIEVGENAHNSIVSLDGTRLFLGTTTKLTVFNAKDGRVLKSIPDVGESGVFPYTVNSKLAYAFVCLGRHVGFDVVDLNQGKAVHRVLAGEAPIAHRTHGAALTPDESELWISDQDGKKLFIFDATQMPPVAKGNVSLSVGGHGWVNFSLDGQYAWCHTPDVFDARTKKQVATLRDENGKPFGSSKLIEVHFKDGKVVRMSSEFGLGRAGH